jgi:exonuclease SbcD
MRLDYDNVRTRARAEVEIPLDNRSPVELFADFYTMQNGKPMSEEQSELISKLAENIWEEEI